MFIRREWTYNGDYDCSVLTVKIYLFPPFAVLDWIGEQIKKLFTYSQAIHMQEPYWNGEEWVEGCDIGDIPF
jgi:hypothetical protein